MSELPTVEIEGRYRLGLLADIDELPPYEDGEVRKATLADLAAIVAALPDADRGAIITELVKSGHFGEIDEAADREASKLLEMSDDELRAEIEATCEHPERWDRWSAATGRWATMCAKYSAKARESESRAVALEARLAEALKWPDDNQPIPEDEAIAAAHPVNSGEHPVYQEAMRMVGAKRSKGALVDLVSWLLVRVKKSERKLADAAAYQLDIRDQVAEALDVHGHRQWLDDIIPRAHQVMRLLRETESRLEYVEGLFQVGWLVMRGVAQEHAERVVYLLRDAVEDYERKQAEPRPSPESTS